MNNLLSVTDGNQKIYIPSARIIYFKANRAYTIVTCFEGKQYYKSLNIGKLEKLFTPSGIYFRCHESWLVNTDWVDWYMPVLNGSCTLINGVHLPVARRKVKAFEKLRRKITAGKEKLPQVKTLL